MSENNLSFTIAGLEMSTCEHQNLALPAWLPEALLIGQYWQSSGLLAHLQRYVHVSRGRMGRYEVCDFVLLLLGYAVSGASSLAHFFTTLQPVESVLMAVWGRQQCPVASTLSRYLKDVDQGAVDALRDLFETEWGESTFPVVKELGITDRTGQRWVVFDVDGTVKAVRHRVLPTQGTHPELKRRSRAACAPGYRGRKRGEAVRTRTTIAHAHTREWLGTFAGAGNGDAKAELKQACGVLERYCSQLEIPIEQAIVRLDGLYGSANYLSIVQQYRLMYISRCRDYHLLKDPRVKAQLAEAPQQQYQHPDHPTVKRDLFDIPCVDATRRGYVAPLRLIVVRMIRLSKLKPSVGKYDGKYVYEVFLTSLPVTGFSAADVLSLYNGRGGFEQTLSEEDTEQDCDRWCSWQPHGQSFWQILSQWVWNWRIRMGWRSQSSLEVRQTLWSPALQTNETDLTCVSGMPCETVPTVDTALAPAPKYGPMTVATGWGHSRHRYSDKDFKILEDDTVVCPAGHHMARQEIRYNQVGDMQMIFGIKAKICGKCPVINHCHGSISKNTRGRRVTIIRKQLPSPPPLAEVPEIVVQLQTMLTQLGTKAMIWKDLPATAFRRHLRATLEQNQIEIEAVLTPTNSSESVQPLLTRHQRAHRRLSWEQRLKRNRLKKDVIHWRVQLFGITPALTQFLKWLQDKHSEYL